MHFPAFSSLQTERRFKTEFRTWHWARAQPGWTQLSCLFTPAVPLLGAPQDIFPPENLLCNKVAPSRWYRLPGWWQWATTPASASVMSFPPRKGGNDITEREMTGKEEMNSVPQTRSPWEIRKLKSLNISAINFLSREPKGKNYICISFNPEFFSWNSLLIVPVYRTIFSTCSQLAATEDQLCPPTCPCPAHTLSLLPSPQSWLEVTLRKHTKLSRPPENNWLSLWKYLTDAPLPQAEGGE